MEGAVVSLMLYSTSSDRIAPDKHFQRDCISFPGHFLFPPLALPASLPPFPPLSSASSLDLSHAPYPWAVGGRRPAVPMPLHSSSWSGLCPS